MTHVFEKRRSRLQAMKALHESYLTPERAILCPACGVESPREDVESALSVCPACGHHFPMGAKERLSRLMDDGRYRELFGHVEAGNPLGFPGDDGKLREAREKSGLQEALLVATGAIEGHACVVCVLDSRFMMGSMGSAVGEKLTQGIEYAARRF